MNVLFLSLIGYKSINDRDLYTDLLRVFIKQGHSVYIISPAERRYRIKTGIIKEQNSIILRVKTGNIQKTNLFEKGFSTLLLEPQFVSAIKKYFNNVKFDLVLYSTPPITIAKAVEYVKKRDNATTYLMLKDIFPQNAVDLGLISKTGVQGLLYNHFRNQEKRLYALSDYIGCMSPANVEYVIRNNPEVKPSIVEVCPNSIEIVDKSIDENKRKHIREKYGISLDRKVFIYGGNLGKPQGIPFLIDCLKECKDFNEVFFLIIGDGTDYYLLERYIETEKPANVKLMKKLHKENYEMIVAASDVGMVFLDYRFTIPNFPSRIVDYMQSKIPIIACTDLNTDIGQIITKGEFGWWCASNSSSKFRSTIEKAIKTDLKKMGEKAFLYLNDNWSVEKQYFNIAKRIGWIM